MCDPKPANYNRLLKFVTFGQSFYQDLHFTINSELTPHRMLRQIILEYDNISYSIELNKIKLNGNSIEKRLKEEEILASIKRKNASDDSIEKRRQELRKEQLENEISRIEMEEKSVVKLLDDAIVKKARLEEVLDRVGSEVERLESEGINFETAEQMYWVARTCESARLEMLMSRLHKNGIYTSIETLRTILRLGEKERLTAIQLLGLPEEAIEALNLIRSQTRVDSDLLIQNKQVLLE